MHIQFTNILSCLIFNYSQNQKMKLRHKKPINSYVGQVAHQSNDAQDEDFVRTSVSCKKNQFIRTKSGNEEIRKYAEFLCQFVNSANKNYQNFRKKNSLVQEEPTLAKGSKQQKELILATEAVRGNICDKSEEVVAKQQQKIQNTLKLINKHPILTKKIRKDKHQLYQLNKNVELRARNVPTRQSDHLKKATLVETVPVDPPAVPKKLQPQQKVPTTQPLTPTSQNPGQGYQIPNAVINQQLQNLLFLQQQLIQNPLYNTNPGLFPMFPMSYPPLFNYQAYLQQMKINNFLAMNNPLGMFSSKLMTNCIPFSKLPHNIANEQKHPKPEQSMPKKDQVVTPIQITQQKPPAQTQKKTTEEKTAQPSQPIQFKSKSCYHIGIAYNIHFSNLKEKGGLSFNSSADYQKIDPTYPAKRARQRKASEGITHIHQTN